MAYPNSWLDEIFSPEEQKELQDQLTDEEVSELLSFPTEEQTLISVPSVPIWSLFKYLVKPDMKGLENIKKDKRVYFTIPSGYDVSEDGDVQVWFMTFPVGGQKEDIKEFFVKPDPGMVATEGSGGGGGFSDE